MAWLISLILLRNRKVQIQHYIWALLPVDMYGVSIAGATLKPYMLFCFFLLMRMFIKGNTKLILRGQWIQLGGVLSFCLLCINLINNQTQSAPKAALMVVIVWVCTVIYITNCKEEVWTDIPNAVVATGVGYGAIFVLGYFLINLGVEVPGIVTINRNQAGMYLGFSNVYQGSLIYLVRLRGFTIDPNTLIGPFAFCGVVSLFRIIKRKAKKLEWMGILLSGACVLLSNSRMGLICFVLLTLITIVAGYKTANHTIRNHLKVSMLVVVFLGAIVIIATDITQNVMSMIVSAYANRSGLTDEYGRLTIWKDAISIWIKHNPLLGIGLGQMQFYTTTHRACHNTWLEMICSSGIFVGGLLVAYFVFLVSVALIKAFQNRELKVVENLLSVSIGLFIVMISLVSVDNITYSYLWFSAAVLSATINWTKIIASEQVRI